MDNFKIIPDSVFDSDITPAAKLIFSLIFSLSRLNNYCYAGNDYLAEKMKASKRSVISWINELAKIGFINIEFKKSHLGTERKIYINLHMQKSVIGGADLRIEVQKSVTRGEEICTSHVQNCVTRGEEICTQIDNTNKEYKIDNREESEKQVFTSILSSKQESDLIIKEEPAENAKYFFEANQILSLLTERTGAKYKMPQTKKGIENYGQYKIIKERIKDGHSLEDIFLVIECKCRDWLSDAKMCSYLTPATLLKKSNFEKYLIGSQIKTSNNVNNGNNEREKFADFIKQVQNFDL